jgi:hypothetical protein
MAEAARPASPAGAGLEAGWLQTIFLMLASRRLNGSPTSVPGQSRHFDRAPPTSGLARLADILRVIRHVSKVQVSDP